MTCLKAVIVPPSLAPPQFRVSGTQPSPPTESLQLPRGSPHLIIPSHSFIPFQSIFLLWDASIFFFFFFVFLFKKGR